MPKQSLSTGGLTQEGCTYLIPWGVLLEIGDGYSRIGRRHKALQSLERFETEEGYVLEPITTQVLQVAIALYRSRLDKEWGLTDCVSFVLMRQQSITEALTADAHFRQAGFTALLIEP